MKFNVENAPELPKTGPQIGYVYASKNLNVTHFWVVIAVRELGVTVLGLDDEGKITSGQNYGIHVFHQDYIGGRRPIGVVKNMPDLVFDIEWIEQ